MAISKPFSIKGQSFITPKGFALWCKVKEPDYKFNSKGVYETSLIVDPNNDDVKLFIDKVNTLLTTAFNEAKNGDGDLTLAPNKAKTLNKESFYKDEYDSDGNETGRYVMKFKMSNVDDLESGRNKIQVVDASGASVKDVPLVGNNSIIRCKVYANPYYMATTNTIGVSFKWQKLQIIDLVSFGDDNDFDAEEGNFKSSSTNDSDEEDF